MSGVCNFILYLDSTNKTVIIIKIKRLHPMNSILL